MMMNNKKIAMLIVKGLADSDREYQEDKRQDDEQGIKTPEKHKKSDDSRMGVEVAMDKFIEAIHNRDTKLAIEAMCEFQEMSSGMEYYDKDSMHESHVDKGE